MTIAGASTRSSPSRPVRISKDPLARRWSLAVPGGTIGRYMNVTVGAPNFTVGDEAVFFLNTRGGGLPAIFGLNQGVFRVSMEGASRRRIVTPPLMSRGTRPETVVRGDPARRPVPLETFGAQVQSVVAEAGRSRPMRRTAPLNAPRPVAAHRGGSIFAATPVLGYLKLGTRVGIAHGEHQVERFPHSLLRDRAGDDRRDRPAVPDRDLGVVRRMGRRRDRRISSADFAGFTAANPLSGDSMTVIGYQNRPDLDRVLARDQLHHRHADRGSGRVRHLLQHRIPLVDRRRRRAGTPRRAVDRRPRDRPSAGTWPLGARRDRGDPRRTARARRRSRHVSDRVCRRQHPRPHAQGR